MALSTTIALRERLRLRELFKYACSAPAALSCPSTRSGSAQLKVDDEPPAKISEVTLQSPRLSPDPALTAFAQLAALRLQCQRCVISLIGGADQHILAEATQTISLYTTSAHAPGDGLVFGAQSVDGDHCLCLYTRSALTDGPENWVKSNTMVANDTRVTIRDLTAEPRTCSLPFVQKFPTLRYYIEVPLVTPTGYMVGSICVLDPVPRALASEAEVQILQEIAKMTMRHLELVRMKEDHNRAERLLQGLSHFNQGQSSLAQWVKDTPGQSLASDKEHQDAKEQQAPLTYQNIPAVDRPTRPSMVSEESVTPSTQPNEYFSESHPASSSATTISVIYDQDASLPPPTPGAIRTDVDNRSDVCTVNSAEDDDSRQSLVSTGIKEAFSRASNLIRESMDLEATCFLEISADGRFNHRNRGAKGKPIKRMPFAPPDSVFPSDTGTTSATTTSSSDHSAPEDTRDRTLTRLSAADSPGAEKYCERLGFSTRFKSSVANSSITRKSLSIPEALLNKLASRYPSGHIFSYDAFGVLSSGDDSTQRSAESSSDKPQSRRKKLAGLVSEYFPNARSLIFLPLYDNEKQHLYAAFVGWSTEPQRVLQKNEIVYVSGFTNSIMCEVMRLETLALDKAKSDFMSSMSHELRSPLHGILAATQLIQESGLSLAQGELATMVDTCGRTLLDIMNNLLDHAKINHFTDNNNKISRKRTKSTGAASQEIYNLMAQVDLASVVEETVASVAAGHSVREHRLNQFSGRRESLTSCRTIDTDSGDQNANADPGPGDFSQPAVIIDVQHRDSWIFETEAGSWRRVVMNLVGNSLKYTQSGHIHISLQAAETSSSRRQQSKRSVVLTVSDTGQGISEGYLKHRLYMPFSQENNLSVGAGLGLSIVNQIVSSLKGDIRIESEVGSGTKVIVTIPLISTPNRPSIARTESKSRLDPIRELAKTQSTICFLGFDVYPALDSQPSGTLSNQALTMMRLKQSLSEMSTKWFGLKVTADISEATIKVMEESYARRIMAIDSTSLELTDRAIIVSAYGYKRSIMKDWPGICDYICAPIGPTKFARALSAAAAQRQPVAKLPKTQMDEHSHVVAQRSEPPAIGLSTLARNSLTSEQLSPDRSPSQPEDITNKMRLLLVEDNDINLRILASIVRKLKLTYVTASNGQQALDRYRESFEQGKHFDYVFMDISMPVMDGMTSTRHIRMYEKEKKITNPTKIIALTGLASAQAQKDALASGVNLFYRKPVKLNLIRELLSEKEGKSDEDSESQNDNESDRSKGSDRSSSDSGSKQ